jgi:hypothetical protein
LQTVVEASLSVQNLVQTTVWPTTDHQLNVALYRDDIVRKVPMSESLAHIA